MQKQHTGTILTLGIVAITAAGTLFALTALFPHGQAEAVDEGGVTAETVFAGASTGIAEPTPAVAVDPSTFGATPAIAATPNETATTETLPADGTIAEGGEGVAEATTEAATLAPADAVPAEEPAAVAAAPEPVAADPVAEPARQAEPPAPVAAAPKDTAPKETAPTETAMATPPKPSPPRKPAAADPHKADIALRWWPDPGKTPPDHLALVYAGQVAGQKAIALLFSGDVSPASVSKYVQVKDESGKVVPGKWEASQNPRMAVFKTGKAGMYALEIDAELADQRGQKVTTALAGPVQIQ